MSENAAGELDFQSALAYETAVVPRYARMFGELLLRAVIVPARANILDLSCRTGYPGIELLRLLGEGRVVSIDPDPSFLELARERGGEDVGRTWFLKEESVEALPFGNGVFTNVVGNLVDRTTTDRGLLLSEAARVLMPGGQLVITMPLRGSFGEVLDLFREVALKHDLAGVSERIEQYAMSLPSREMWQTEIESRGFSEVAIEQDAFALEFETGHQVFSDPVTLVAAAPEWQWIASAVDDPAELIYRVQDAVDVYFRGRVFDTTVVTGCASARLPR
ncbi:MAG: class I SAM-dependent methyltransferase [Deltaproteobacteria bacterium]